MYFPGKRKRDSQDNPYLQGVSTPDTPYGAFLHGPNPNTQTRKYYKKHCENMGKFELPEEEIQAKKAKLDNENNQNLHKSHQCDQCPKNFTNKCYLDRHIRKFHEKVKYSCELCDKKFTETWTLKSHVLGVHEKLKRFKCNQCDKAYPQASGLSQHKRKIHPEEKSNQN